MGEHWHVLIYLAMHGPHPHHKPNASNCGGEVHDCLPSLWRPFSSRPSQLQASAARFPQHTLAAPAHAAHPSAVPRPPQDGDTITVDVAGRKMDIVGVSEQELAARKAAWVAPPLKATSGTLYKYIKMTSSASEGCVTDA